MAVAARAFGRRSREDQGAANPAASLGAVLELLRALNWLIRADVPWPTKRGHTFDFVLVGDPGVFALSVTETEPEGLEEAAAALGTLLDGTRVQPVVCRAAASLGPARPEVLYCTPETALDLLIGLKPHESPAEIRTVTSLLRDLEVPPPPEPEPVVVAPPVVAPPAVARPVVAPAAVAPVEVRIEKRAEKPAEKPQVKAAPATGAGKTPEKRAVKPAEEPSVKTEPVAVATPAKVTPPPVQPKAAEPKVVEPKVAEPKVVAPKVAAPQVVKPAVVAKPAAAPAAPAAPATSVEAAEPTTASPSNKTVAPPAVKTPADRAVTDAATAPVTATPDRRAEKQDVPKPEKKPAAKTEAPRPAGRHRSERPRRALSPRRTPPPPPTADADQGSARSTLELPTALVPSPGRVRGGENAGQRFDNGYVYVPEPASGPGPLRREFRARAFIKGIFAIAVVVLAVGAGIRAWPQLAGLVNTNTHPSVAFGGSITVGTTNYHPKLTLTAKVPQRLGAAAGLATYAIDLTAANRGSTSWPLPARSAFVLVDSLGESHALVAIDGKGSSTAGEVGAARTWSGRIVFKIRSNRTPLRLRLTLAADGSESATWTAP